MDNENSNVFLPSDDDKEIITKSVKLINDWYDYFETNIKHFNEDFKFIHIDQWAPAIRQERELKKQEILEANHLYSYCAKMVGEAIKNDTELSVRPDMNVMSASSNIAQILDGRLRKVLLDNKYTAQKIKVFGDAVFGGFGVYWVDFDYENPYSFHKKVTIRALSDPTQAFFDVLAEEDTKADGEFCGYFESFSIGNFRQTFPKAKSDLSFKSLAYVANNSSRWRDGKIVRVAYLWRKEYYSETIALLSNGESMPLKDAEELINHQKSLIRKLKKNQEEGIPVNPELLQEVEIIDTRVSNKCYKIMFYKMIADEILERTEWPSPCLPGVFVDHNSVLWSGKQFTKSYHRNAQDVQRYLNFCLSQGANDLRDLPRGSWLANPEQLDGNLINLWKNPNDDKFLLIANRDSQGQMPTYVPPPSISRSYAEEKMSCLGDIQNILGRFDAGRGQQDNAISGIAVMERAKYENIGSYLPFHHLENADLAVGNVVLSLFPAVYNKPRIIGVMGKNNNESQVQINYKTPDGLIKNDMSKSWQNYGVHLENSMSFAVQREAANMQLKELIQNNPTLAPLLSDLFAENLDVPNAYKIMKRIQLFLLGNPVSKILEMETGMQPPPPPPTPPNPMAMVEQAKMQNEQSKTQNERLKILTERQSEHEANLIKQGQIENDAMANNIKSQELMGNAIDNHAKTMASVHESSAKIVDAQIKAQAEIEKAKMDENPTE